MSKNKYKQIENKHKNTEIAVETGRGIIRDNFLAAIVTSKVYRQQVVKAKKGKGTYQRKTKHKNSGQESYLMAA